LTGSAVQADAAFDERHLKHLCFVENNADGSFLS
jgi:hypothetical protein